jgi:hypothetical protein
VRRLGYLLELAGHEPQARALDKFARQARTVKLLDPTSKMEPTEMSGRWKIAVNKYGGPSAHRTTRAMGPPCGIRVPAA